VLVVAATVVVVVLLLLVVLVVVVLDGTRASTRACSRFFSVFRTSSWMYGLSASSVACAGAAG
jgi:hypothetical protein